jgi:preprotein translocase subunit SecF
MMLGLGQLGGRLYRGEVSINFVGRQRTWYTISGLILLIAIVALSTRWLNFSVDFKGGSILQFSAPGATLAQLHNAVANSPAGSQAIIQHVGLGSNWQMQSAKLDFAQLQQVERAITNAGIHATGFSPSFVSGTWGSEITGKALKALIVFLIVIVIYLSIAFEWKMATAAFVALIHDIVITVGVYSLFGFTVSPASVIGLLTILGYSLYDTVVVFDKVRENTAGLVGSGRSTYSQAANLALNQTLIRSINTSIIALLPVAAILFIGSAVLGPGELQDLALVLFVGMLSGTYSSLCIATPVLADLKEREPQYKALAKRVALREAGGRSARRQAAKAEKAEKALAGGSGGTARRPAGSAGAAAGLAGATAGPARAGAADRSATPSADQDSDQEIGDGGADYADEPEDTPPAGDQEAAASTTDKVPAGQGTSRATPAPRSVRPGPRQQPRRTTAAGRRPGGKKKKR